MRQRSTKSDRPLTVVDRYCCLLRSTCIVPTACHIGLWKYSDHNMIVDPLISCNYLSGDQIGLPGAVAVGSPLMSLCGGLDLPCASMYVRNSSLGVQGTRCRVINPRRLALPSLVGEDPLVASYIQTGDDPG